MQLSAAPLAFLPHVGLCLTGIRHLPSPLQPLCIGLPNSRPDMTSYANNFTLLASAPSIVEAEARAIQLCSSLSLLTLTSSGSTLNCRTPKILGVTLDTHFTFVPHAPNCVEWASRALNVMKALAGPNRGFTTETYKAIVRPILNYAPPPSGSPKGPHHTLTNLR